ncbi:hypothetical protein OKA04_10645 [Luteolibacter flavescens]|uniref:Uncharacterized protein n=1 Tax=Luteolibacter flavescens TaxID=1859460 RepID=A0ABT3FPK3_9BACT|nr:hypothetical protein [Luteolibacter flavescens]MCW1885186.1 hypothetical protein [Luteolibacter flavescens]
MNEVRKLDSRRRVTFPDRYSPGDVFVEEEVTADRVVFRLLKSADVPVAGVIERDGKLFVDRPFDRDAIRDAIRAERDER